MSLSTNEKSITAGNAQLISNFLEMMSAERGARQNTLEAYRRDLSDYGDVFAADFCRASSDDIRDYLRIVKQQGLAASTAARRLSAVRQFHKFLYAEGLSEANPATVIEGPGPGPALTQGHVT